MSLSDADLEPISTHKFGLFAEFDQGMISIFPETVFKLLVSGSSPILLIDEASADDLSEMQVHAIGDNYAVKVVLLRDGIEVFELFGSAEIVISSEKVVSEVNRVDPDGVLILYDILYDRDRSNVTFFTDHLSVFMLSMEKDSVYGQIVYWLLL